MLRVIDNNEITFLRAALLDQTKAVKTKYFMDNLVWLLTFQDFPFWIYPVPNY